MPPDFTAGGKRWSQRRPPWPSVSPGFDRHVSMSRSLIRVQPPSAPARKRCCTDHSGDQHRGRSESGPSQALDPFCLTSLRGVGRSQALPLEDEVVHCSEGSWRTAVRSSSMMRGSARRRICARSRADLPTSALPYRAITPSIELLPTDSRSAGLKETTTKVQVGPTAPLIFCPCDLRCAGPLRGWSGLRRSLVERCSARGGQAEHQPGALFADVQLQARHRLRGGACEGVSRMSWWFPGTLLSRANSCESLPDMGRTAVLLWSFCPSLWRGLLRIAEAACWILALLTALIGVADPVWHEAEVEQSPAARSSLWTAVARWASRVTGSHARRGDARGEFAGRRRGRPCLWLHVCRSPTEGRRGTDIGGVLKP